MCAETHCSGTIFDIGYPDQTQLLCGDCVIFDASVNQNRPLYYGLVSSTYNWPHRSITCRECDSVNEYRTMVANQWVCQGMACRDCPSCRKEPCNSCGANLPPNFYQQNLVKFGFEHTCCHNIEDVRNFLNLPIRSYNDDGVLVETPVPAPTCAPNWILVRSFHTYIWNNEYLEKRVTCSVCRYNYQPTATVPEIEPPPPQDPACSLSLIRCDEERPTPTRGRSGS